MKHRVKEDFFNRVEQEQRYLAYGDYSFEELLKKSLKDRRVRNVFVFYVLSKQEYYQKFMLLAEHKHTVQRLRSSLYKALLEAEKDRVYQPKVRKLARELRYKYFSRSQVVTFTQRRNYDESKEMEKFFVSVANHIVNEKEDDSEKEAYVAERMKDIDFDNLFISR
ncbi:hypothetical protein [Litchfieldia alkalitelluris]|uniref:hypothetical protein n=1 Tax=Litchfieldia alkalitelluris TaxID=304268 RepID=UPI0009969F2A|nr:hypothetical protein [Litchfieldia alkalitelluris]